MERRLTLYDMERMRAKLGSDHPFFNPPDSEDEDIWGSNYEYEPQPEPSLVYGPNPLLYHVLTLLSFSNLQCLEFDCMPLFRGVDHARTDDEDFYYTLPWFFRQSQGRTFFRHLTELKCGSGAHMSVGEIGSCLQLPRLKALMIDKCRDSGDRPWTRLDDDWLPAGHIPPPESLVFLRTKMPHHLVGKLLKPLVSLRTFVWEDAMHVYEGGDPDAERGYNELSFRPQALVENLLFSQHGTLEHLVLIMVT